MNPYTNRCLVDDYGMPCRFLFKEGEEYFCSWSSVSNERTILEVCPAPMGERSMIWAEFKRDLDISPPASRSLLSALLLQMIKDYLPHQRRGMGISQQMISNYNRQDKFQREAEDFIFGKDDSAQYHFASFEYICELIGIDAGMARRRLAKLKAEGTPPQYGLMVKEMDRKIEEEGEISDARD